MHCLSMLVKEHLLSSAHVLLGALLKTTHRHSGWARHVRRHITSLETTKLSIWSSGEQQSPGNEQCEENCNGTGF